MTAVPIGESPAWPAGWDRAWRKLKTNYFRNVRDGATTLLVVGLAFYILYLVIPWAVLNATWTGTGRADCQQSGACWAFITSRFSQFMFGFYPSGQQWRVELAGGLFAIGFVSLAIPRLPFKSAIGAFVLFVLPAVGCFLLAGGALGLEPVGTEQWGGLMLTLIVATSVFGLSFVLGLMLMLGRSCDMPVFKLLSTLTIELCRGLPLVMVLFMAITMLPFFFPSGFDLNKLALTILAMALFQSAFFAEVFRGGLQAIGKGQYEACTALGLGYWKAHCLVILPQVIRNTVPAIINNSISLIKDTTLIMVVGLFDLLNIVSAGTADPNWLGSTLEGYVFVGLVFWIVCFCLSRCGESLERSLRKG